jgi:hypothetical protein
MATGVRKHHPKTYEEVARCVKEEQGNREGGKKGRNGVEKREETQKRGAEGERRGKNRIAQVNKY